MSSASPTASSFHFKIMPTETERGVFISVQGAGGAGKTDFLFSAPDPILYLNLDGANWQRVRDRYPGKKIYIEDFNMPDIPPNSTTDSNQAAAMPIWTRLKNVYLEGERDPSIRTIGLDKGNTAWALARLAYLGKLKGTRQVFYDEVNADYRSLLIRMSNSKKVNILISSEEDEYLDNNRTGRLRRSGFKEVEERVEDVVRCFREDGKFKLHVLMSKTRPALDNTLLEQPNCGFVDLAMRLFPNGDVTKWL